MYFKNTHILCKGFFKLPAIASFLSLRSLLPSAKYQSIYMPTVVVLISLLKFV